MPLERPERLPLRFPLVQDPPFTLEGARTFLFVLACPEASLRDLLDRTFGWAAPEVTVEPLASACLLVVTDTDRAHAADPALGHFRYQEVTFFVPVRGTRNGQPFQAFHVPFIYPSEGLAVAAGREIYGLPKKPASVQVPSFDDFWDGRAKIASRVLGARAFDGSGWGDEPLVTIEAEAQGPAAALADDVLDGIDQHLGAAPLPGHLFGQDLLQLKQVPDVSTGGVPPRALYRAVTHVRAPVSGFGSVRLGDASKVRIHLNDLASEPIREVLGLGATVTPLLAASLSMDFGFEAGEVWLERPDSGRVPPEKTKVVILGGGLSALATAHMLTDTEERRRAYDVRVLCQGHILGGKGGSWRNRERADRVEEHGIHVIFGFYHNFLRLFRGVYEELQRPTHVDPSSFAEAFLPKEEVVFHDGDDGFLVRFPRTPAGYGAGPTSLEQQLLFLSTFVQSVFDSALSGLVGGVLPGGNRVAKEIAAFTATLIKGVMTDVVLGRKSWEELDQEDFRAWMARHNPFPVDLSDTAIMQVPYDGVFAYRGSDQSDPTLSAGIAARGLLKLVSDYERAVFYEMSTGMGEAVFAPMYELLKRRGVTFEFFSKVKELHVSGSSAERVVYAHQATVSAGPDAYEPLERIGTVPCFRQHPDLSQLEQPAPIAGKDPYSDAVDKQVSGDLSLRKGIDFDWVVCALPAPVTAQVLRGAAAGSPLADIARIPTVATLHLQAWFDDARPALGWGWGEVVLGGFEQPLNSLQENTRLLGVEGWGGPHAPRFQLYASGPFGGGWTTDATDPAARDAAAAAAVQEATTWTRTELVRLLSAAKDPEGKLDLSRLHAPWSPQDPMADQYVRGNIDASARYVLAEPGGLGYRPEPVWSAQGNLRLAGDWTKNGIDIPCMEGAVVSARMAAASILGVDPDILW